MNASAPSFTDSLQDRPAARLAANAAAVFPAVFPTGAPDVVHLDRRGLSLRWTDGGDVLLDHRLLRGACRCGDCRRTGPPPDTIAMRLIDARPAGPYGLQLVFDDGHDRGIYPWAYLRELAASVPATLPPSNPAPADPPSCRAPAPRSASGRRRARNCR